MRLYLEAMEIVVGEDVEAEFIRADVTSFTDSEIDNVKRAIAEIMAGLKRQLPARSQPGLLAQPERASYSSMQ